jgi:REP element-mobilizing transposase RayT
MARKVRIQYPGAIYHVMNRGDRREAIFADDEDRQRLLQTLTQAREKTAWQIHAYCLMCDHFHLVIETPQPNLVVEGLRRLGWSEADLVGRRKAPQRVDSVCPSGSISA